MNPGNLPLTAGKGYSSDSFSWFFDPPDAINPLATWHGVAGDFIGNKGTTMPDFLIYSTDAISNTLVLQVFEGNSGQFAALPRQTFPFSSQSYPSNPAVLDVDGDGKLDLLIGNTVAYGNGDGTFSRVAGLPLLATGFNQTYAADVNGDGKPDIVAVNTPPSPTDNPATVQFTFTVFRNEGNGTFTSMGALALAPSFQTGVNMCCALYNVFGLSFGDVNGDGKLDVLSQSNSVPDGNAEAPNQFNVVLNNGDGTFGAPKPIEFATCSFSPATVNVSGTTATTVTLTVTATSASTTAQASSVPGKIALAFGIPLFSLLGIRSAGSRRTLFSIAAITLCCICLGCGSGGTQTHQPPPNSLKPGSYAFYVTAISGQNEIAINALLTVQ